METLNAIDPGQFTDPSARIEYYYRKGRITELKGQKKQAVHELEKAYQDGRTLPYTFATRAAFYLGKIYEEQGDFKTAALWYDRCIEAYSPEHTTEGILDSAERGAKRAKAQF
jgi:tetratricopeptide (TPR) repeat protein